MTLQDKGCQNADDRMYSGELSEEKTLPGADKAEVFITLQRRWEDSDALNLYAKRYRHWRELYPSSSAKGGWKVHRIPVLYTNITSLPSYAFMGP